jgi:hypothetical protein
MGIMKQYQITEMERHQDDRHCRECGGLLTAEETDTGRDLCFDCYCHNQI